MKTIRRLLVCALACALLLGTQPAAAAQTFADVPAGHWAAGYIARAAQAGLVKGERPDTFGLGQPMTRAAFTVVLCRLFGWQSVTPAAGSFDDNADPAAWYYTAVETALANGAVTRQSDRFRPADPITREELAVMLVRSLGYTAIAGLDQGLRCPFADADANKGYLTMACSLGIAGGANGRFSPDARASREQAVAMLMRTADVLARRTPELLAAAATAADLPQAAVLSTYRAVAVGRTVLTQGALGQSAAETAALRAQVQAAGVSALLYVTGGAAALGSDPAAAARAVAAAVTAGSFDGAMVDLTNLPASAAPAYTAMAAALRTALGKRLLVLTAQLPAPGESAGGYACGALAAQADRLVIRTAAIRAQNTGGFPVAPSEPLETVYYALASLKAAGVSGGKLSLWLTADGSAWSSTGRELGRRTPGEIAALLAQSGAGTYSSARYGTDYLVADSGRTVVWYHDGAAAAARVRLGAFFGVGSLCLSTGAAADYPGGGLVSGLGC